MKLKKNNRQTPVVSHQTFLTNSLFLFFIFSFVTLITFNSYSQCGGGHDHGSKSSTAKSDDKTTTGEVMYVCPMHPEVTSKMAGSCSKCSMALEAKTVKSSEKTNANTKTETFGVRGSCGMCKKTIEGALKNQKGISSGEWNQESKQLTVAYDPNVIKIEKIHKLIADTGYDTDKVKAKDKNYNKLSGCCRYEREK